MRLRLGLGLPRRERRTVEDTEPPYTLTHHHSTHYTLTSHITAEPEPATNIINADSKGCGGEDGKEEGGGDKDKRKSEGKERLERSTRKRGRSSPTSLSHKAKEDILNYLSR